MKHTDAATLRSTLRHHGVCVLIPTYNNAGTVGHVVTETLKYCDNVIVVNDGSTDGTAEILAGIEGIDVVGYAKNCGKGTALKRGFKHARERGFKYAITMDSDGQHYPEDIELFAKAIVENPGSLIVGKRDLSDVDIKGSSTFANKFSNFWFFVQTGQYLADTQTGYRAYPLDKLHWLSLLTSRYEAELELLAFASWNGVRIVSIPINVYYPPRAERVTHFKPGLDFTRISILNTVLCLVSVLYGLPAAAWNLFAKRRIFNGEFKAFTRKKGRKKPAATTLGRLARSLYGGVYFVFWSVGIFTPLSFLYFAIGRNTERKKVRYHKKLQWISRFLTRRFPGAKTTYRNHAGETFDRPSLIICNHQSHLDLPVMMSLHPKLIFLTNDWVWNNFFYGRLIHYAEFLPVSMGVDELMPRLRSLRDRGYSVVIFPEGTRSADCSIQRFHQGAFLLARELKLDIVPMVLHGVGHYMPKGELMFRKGNISLDILERHEWNDEMEQTASRKLASQFRSLIRSEYDRIAAEKETSAYFRALVLYKYAYRGWATVAECRRTLRRRADYAFVDNEDPDVRTVRIVNAGIGVVPLLYALVNKNVEVYAFEGDRRRYETAANTADLPANLHYVHAVWESDYDPEGVTFDKTYNLKQ